MTPIYTKVKVTVAFYAKPVSAQYHEKEDWSRLVDEHMTAEVKLK